MVRMEDLDRVTANPAHEQAQLRDLTALGLDWDGEVVRQSQRFHLYEAAIDDLQQRGLCYPCFCSRREIREAARAPHGVPSEGAYPGTCARLSTAERSELARSGRPSALRLHASGAVVTVHDRLAGELSAVVDDVVVRRNDGVPAYNLAVVVDDAAQRITEVVRGDDLLATTPRQVHLQRLLGLPTPAYMHVPLVVGADGLRLAKRHGAVTLAALAARGVTAQEVVAILARSLGWGEVGTPCSPQELVASFDPDRLPRAPWTWTSP